MANSDSSSSPGSPDSPRDESAASTDDLIPVVYDELRRVAARYLRDERAGHTLQPTALVHEAYLQLADRAQECWVNRDQFVGTAAMVIRRVLIQHARKRGRLKRGGQRKRLTLDTSSIGSAETNLDVLEFDEAMLELGKIDPIKERIVELRFFAGLTVDQVADVTDTSPRTIARHWRMARAWLRVHLEGKEQS